MTMPRLVAYDFPLRRDGLLVRITLPPDLTVADAERVGRFVRTLPMATRGCRCEPADGEPCICDPEWL